MGFFSDSSVLSQIFQMVFFLDYAAVTGFLCWNRYSIWYFFQTLLCCPYGISVPTQETCYSSIESRKNIIWNICDNTEESGKNPIWNICDNT
jgi:hypothetical protein